MAPVLVTDDDLDTRIAVAEILKANGYNVFAAGGSAEVSQNLRAGARRENSSS